MDKRLIDSGRARIALNMLGFAIYCFGMILAFIFAGAEIRTSGVRSGGVFGLVAALLILVGALYILGRCLGGIVQGIAEIVRGVNAPRPAPTTASQV